MRRNIIKQTLKSGGTVFGTMVQEVKTASIAQMMKQIGFDFVMPYCEGRNRDKEAEQIEKVIEYLAPLKFYLHTTIRREPPHNYQLPPKGPKYIKNIIKWGKDYFQKNERFIGMSFFNEVKIPEENRQAVYDSI